MTRSLLALALALPLLPSLRAARAPEAGSPPGAVARDLPAGAVARVDGEVVTLDEYAAFLVESYGRGPLRDLIDRRLVRRAGELRGVAVTDEAVARAVDSAWSAQLARFRGDEAQFAREIERGGFRVDEYRAQLAERARDELVCQELVLADRVVTDEAVRARFERDFGIDGDKVEVRHIVLTAARARADLIQAGTPPSKIDPAALERDLEARARAVLAELRDGADFAALARARSHDIAAQKTGGALPGYNYLTYGEEFAAAVRDAAVGEPVGPVRTQAGYHVIEVTARVHTELEDVREGLRATLAAEPADSREVEALKERLRAAASIETY